MFFSQNTGCFNSKGDQRLQSPFQPVIFSFYCPFSLLYQETKLQKEGGGKDLNHLLMQNTKNFYFRVAYFLIRYCTVLQFSCRKIPPVSSEVPAAHIPAAGTSKTSQELPSLNSSSFSSAWEGTGLLWSAALH